MRTYLLAMALMASPAFAADVAKPPPAPNPDQPVSAAVTLQEWRILFSAIVPPPGLPGDAVRGIQDKIAVQLQQQAQPPQPAKPSH